MDIQRALILGATGVVGGALARELAEQGIEVFGAARLSDPARAREIAGLGVELIRFDATSDDPATLPDADVVFLEIWDPTRPDLIWPINFYGVGRVVERYAGQAHFVNGSTISLYGERPDAPSEETPCAPTDEYGRSRYAQERLIDYFCQRSGSRGIHVRYAHANTATNGFIYRTARAILAGESLGQAPDSRHQMIGLEDFVRVTLAAVDRLACPPAIVNCCHPRVWTLRELAETLHQRLGRGRVVFDRESGGVETSVYADVSRMIEWFGEPRVAVEVLLERVANAPRTSSNG